LTIAVDADSGQDDVRFRHVSAADLGRLGTRRLQIRHKRRRDGPLAVAKAIPARSRRAGSQHGWLGDVVDHPDYGLRRADAQVNILAVSNVLASFANWETMLTRPTWAHIMQRTGLKRSTVAAHLAWLRSAGLLGLVVGGTTPQFSPGVLHDQGDEPEQNEAAVYVLCAPVSLRLVAVSHPDDVGAEYVDDGRDDRESPQVSDCSVDRTWTPSPSRSEGIFPARESKIRNQRDSHQNRPEPAPAAPERPTSKAERCLTAMEARRRLPVLANMSTAYVAALFREWHLAGWSLSDVLTALQRTPDGEQHRFTDAVRNVPGWVRYRLQAWRSDPANPTSPPGHSPAERLRADAILVRARQRARADAAAHADRSAAPAPAVYWEAKAVLQQRLAERRRRHLAIAQDPSAQSRPGK
jgi:hypothetical protein